MADYTPYIPSVGSIDYPTQISTFMILSEAIDTEIETARNGEANLLDHFNLKFNNTGGILTGALTLSSTSPTMWFIESGVTVNNGKWSFVTNAEEFSLRANNDALNIFTDIFKATRTGTTIDSFEITSTSSTINGNTIWHAGTDGPGTGLDADTLDTYEGDDYARKAATQTITANWNFSQNSSSTGKTLILLEDTSTDNGLRLRANTNGDIALQPVIAGVVDSNKEFYFSTLSGVWKFDLNGSPYVGNNEMWHAGNDGPGSGLNADLLDGVEGSSYIDKTTSQTITALKTFSAGDNANLLKLQNTTTTNALVVQTYTSNNIGIRPAPGGIEDGAKDFFYNFTSGTWDFDVGGAPRIGGNTIATLVSPTFTGTPSLPTGTTAVTQAAGNNTTRLATTAFIQSELATRGIINRVYVSNSAGAWTLERQTKTSGKGFVTSLTDIDVGQCRLNFTAVTSTNNLYFNAISSVTSGLTSIEIYGYTTTTVIVRLFGTSSNALDSNFFIEIFVDE